jgi:hypothetical protein
MPSQFLDLTKLRTFPLAERKSLLRLEEVLLSPAASPPPCPEELRSTICCCAADLLRAKKAGSAAILLYGAHLVRNGAGAIVREMVNRGLITHLATNGAGAIHDWEFSHRQQSTEPVAENVAQGRFGTWDETGRFLHLALLAGSLREEGFGKALGRFVEEDGTQLPEASRLEELIRQFPSHPLTAARADFLAILQQFPMPPGWLSVPHPGKQSSLLAGAFCRQIPVTIHPGIGYDIIACHPMFHGAVIGRAAALDFRLFAGSANQLEGGVVISIGSAIMAPQVFEKSLSCVNNLRLQEGRPPLSNFSIYVVDLQEGGDWDWRKSEPPRENPAYYLRFMKSFSRMGGELHYLQCDNRVFIHNLFHDLENLGQPSLP